MKKSKFTESQIIGILKHQESGKSVTEICREFGVSQPTFYSWKAKYSGMEVAQLKRLKELETEISQYKRIVAEQTLQLTVLKDVIEESFRACRETRTGGICQSRTWHQYSSGPENFFHSSFSILLQTQAI